MAKELVEWVELFAKPIACCDCLDGFRFRLRSLRFGGCGRSTHPTDCGRVGALEFDERARTSWKNFLTSFRIIYDWSSSAPLLDSAQLT